MFEPLEIDITTIPVFWIDTGKNTERMQALFERHRFENVTRVECKSYLEVFKQTPSCGFIILEDSCMETEHFTTKLQIPDNSDAFYLGATIMGYHNEQTGPFLQGNPVVPGIVRVANMLSSHAIYYRSKRYVDACIENMETMVRESKSHDIGLAITMPKYNVYCGQAPILYQKDNEGVTKITLSAKEAQ